jgi:acetylglutamate kinase
VTPLVLKFGGELLEGQSGLAVIASAVSRIASDGASIAIVHGGGREIDAELAKAGIAKRQIEGLRVTDEATLEIVVGVLAGTINTRLVAALSGAGVKAVGLTGADGFCGLSEVAPPHRTVDGRRVDLGEVGVPVSPGDPGLLRTLLADRFVPIIASIGATRQGRLLNINADTMAGHVAATLRARRLVIAGSTPGVVGDDGTTVPLLDPSAIGRLLASGTATAGMVAKLRACEHALAAGVEDVVIVDGRDSEALWKSASGAVPATATRIVTTAGSRQ